MSAAHRRDLARSVRLYRAFRVEQSDPARFYGALAEDSVHQLSEYAPMDGARVLDVGGGPGFFRDAFRTAGAHYVSLDSDVGELAAHAEPGPGTIIGSGMALPVRSGSVDVCYSSNVLEHVPDPWRMADEMVRVTASGGLIFLSYTIWLGPWGGHETAPRHYLGGARAADSYTRRHGHPPKNRYGVSLFPVSARSGLEWAARRERSGQIERLATIPRYLPSWADALMRVPGLREVVTWNLALILRRR